MAMGYDPDWIAHIFGPSLFDVPVQRTRYFVTEETHKFVRRPVPAKEKSLVR